MSDWTYICNAYVLQVLKKNSFSEYRNAASLNDRPQNFQFKNIYFRAETEFKNSINVLKQSVVAKI
jgi:hypothetical protein